MISRALLVVVSAGIVTLSSANPQAQSIAASSTVEAQKLAGDLQQLKFALDQQTAALDRYRKEQADQNAVKNSWWTVVAVPFLAPLGSLIAAIGGWIITYTVLIRGFRQQEAIRASEQERQDALRREDRRHSDGARIESFLVDSLKYFEHGIQERSIGLGLIEGYWNDFPRLQPVWMSVLANQAVFILSKIVKDSGIPSHEVDNLQRIHRLLMNMSLKISLTPHQAASLASTLKAIKVDGLRADEAAAVVGLEQLARGFENGAA